MATGFSLTLVGSGVLALSLVITGCARDDPGKDEIQVTQPSIDPSLLPVPITEAPVEETATFDREAHSIDDPESLWVVTNKLRPLDPTEYQPPDLEPLTLPGVGDYLIRAEAGEAASAMAEAASDQGVGLRVTSAYRSFGTQRSLYQRYVQRSGVAEADTFSARAGYSEHQTGWAIDFIDPSGECTLQDCFEDTDVGSWLAEHAWEYGFILRYPAGQEHVTGYIYEPWHYRYVGTELAEHMTENQIPTLEAVFELPDAGDYDE